MFVFQPLILRGVLQWDLIQQIYIYKYFIIHPYVQSEQYTYIHQYVVYPLSHTYLPKNQSGIFNGRGLHLYSRVCLGP